MIVSSGFASASLVAGETGSDIAATPAAIEQDVVPAPVTQDGDPGGDSIAPDDENGDLDSEPDPASQPVEAGEETGTPDSDPGPVNQGQQNEGAARGEAGVGVSAVAESTVSVSVEMTDGGLVPDGLTASLLPSDSWDAIEIADVPSGSTTASVTLATQVPFGTYQVWITGSGYSSGQVLVLNTETVNHSVMIDRLLGNLSVTLTTSDGGAIPAGTRFDLIDSQDQVVQTVIADSTLSNGSVLPLPPSLEFGTYQLSIEAGDIVDGRQAVPQTLAINMTDPWTTDYAINANIEILTPMSSVGLSVQMLDGGAIPMGLEWSLFPPGSWDAIASGPVTSGDTLFEHVLPEEVPYGVYQLWITGNGYSSGQVINVQSEAFNHGFTLQRLQGTLTITVTTSDGSDIPAGTTWEILDAGNNVVQGGTLTEALPSGSELALTNPFDFGTYTLNMGPADGGFTALSLESLPRELLPHTSVIQINNPWTTEFAANVELVWAQSDVTFSVAMTDGGSLPNGLEWSLFVSGSWDPLASGPVTAGEVSFAGEIPAPVPFGVYQLWITGNGYSSGQVLNIESLETHHDFSLDRLQSEVTITLDTSDNADIPAGTTWSIVDSTGAPVQDGVLTTALLDGGMLPISNPFDFDVYTLVINADGYHPVSMELAVTDPWQSQMTFTVNLVSDRLPEPTPTEPVPTPEPTFPATPTPSPEPTAPATPAPSTPVPSPVTPGPDPEVTPGSPITGLPQTGATGHDNGATMIIMLLLAGTIFAAAGLLVRARYRSNQ